MNSDAQRPDDTDSSLPRGTASAAPRRADLSLEQYEAGVRAGDVVVLARALTLVESTHPAHAELSEQLLARLLRLAGRSLRVGITGPPGVGKSTFIESLGMHVVEQGERVAVLTVDPSSERSGGSILGDKTRMSRLAAHPRAFIRPSPSTGALGGVARTTRESIAICEAAGYPVVFVETVGVGQSETMVADMTDCLVALAAPDGGDELQGIKRGLLERVDLLVVNKADGPSREAAESAAEQYRFALQWLARAGARIPPDVLTCSALYGERIDEIWQTIVQRHAQLQSSGELDERRRRQNLQWLWLTVHEQLRRMIDADPAVEAIRGELEAQVAAGQIPASAAARKILDALAAQRSR